MKTLNFVCLFLALVLVGCTNNAEQHTDESSKGKVSKSSEKSQADQELTNLILAKDSLLFQIGFNQIDTNQISALVTDDLEFYHDINGITESKETFVTGINGLRNLPFKTWRVLVDGSTEVFPLYRNNHEELYGAIQHGIHDFYQQPEGEEARKTSTAKFTHLWILEAGNWKLKRVLSYDHQEPHS